MDIIEAIYKRQSIRSFKDREVSQETVREILNISKFAPSGGNTQPWKVYVLNQNIMKELESAILHNLDNGISEKPNFSIYPQPMSDHLKNRVKECGKVMYGALEIKKDDIEGRLNQLKQNFSVFILLLIVYFISYNLNELLVFNPILSFILMMIFI